MATFSWADLSSLMKASEKRETSPEAEASLVALADVSLTVPKGSLLGICGAVGAGKSAFLFACESAAGTEGTVWRGAGWPLRNTVVGPGLYRHWAGQVFLFF